MGLRSHAVLRWIVTRAAEDCGPIVNALRGAGLTCEAVPCLERTATAWAPWPPAAPGLLQVCLVTSQATAALLAGPHRPPAHVQLAAVAPQTSQALRDAGLTPAVEATGGVEALAEAVARWAQGRKLTVHYPTSDAGLDAPEQQAAVRHLERLGPVTRFAAYATTAPEGLAAALAARGPGCGVVFFSPSAVEHFAAAAPPTPRLVLCHGESTLRAWRERRAPQWPDAVLRDRTQPIEAAVLALEKSLP